MANIIQRIIQLVLDKDSARKVQSETEETTNAMEKSWKSMAGKVAGFLGAAFLTHKIIEFGKASVEEAQKSQAAWSSLANTIDNTGQSFEGMEKQLRATADAFQDATIHDDDAFAESLGRLVSLTDDVSASLNNMGLVANVAAKFFKGDLEAATNLVAKAMNGNTNALKKMGIQANSAQEALDILAKRSMGAASKEAATYAGQVAQLGNAYDDLKKEVGNAIIDSNGAADAFSVLKAAVATLTDWVIRNKEQIGEWVSKGVKFAIDAADVFIRAVMGMANILGGGLQVSLGLATKGLATLYNGLLAVRDGISWLDKLTGRDTTKYDAETKKMQKQADAMTEWADAAIALGSEKVAKGIDVLATPLFSSDQFASAPGKKGPATPGEQNRPMVGSNAKSDEGDAINKALKEFEQSSKAAANMSKILGDNFDAAGAEVERLTKLINALAANGTTPAEQGLGNLNGRLKDLVTNIVPTTTAAKELKESLSVDFAKSALDAANSTDLLANRVEWLKAKQADLMKAMETLKFDENSKAVQRYAAEYRALGEEIQAANLQMVFQELSETLEQNAQVAILNNTDALTRLQDEHAALQKAILDSIKLGDKDSAHLKELKARYDEVTGAIKKQTTAMQIQAATADFLAEALGAALQGGLAEAAAQKAKQNAIEAAEMLVRAGVFALFGDFPHASASLVLAGQFAAVSVAWAALGAASRGGGGGSAPSIATPGGGGGGDLSSGRNASGDAANRAAPPGAEVSIYLTGPGFHALNPEVMKVVRGAQQQADEIYGKNTKIRVVPNGN